MGVFGLYFKTTVTAKTQSPPRYATKNNEGYKTFAPVAS